MNEIARFWLDSVPLFDKQDQARVVRPALDPGGRLVEHRPEVVSRAR